MLGTKLEASQVIVFLSLIVCLVLASCRSQDTSSISPSLTPSSATTTSIGKEGVNLLLVVEGEVQLRRWEWRKFQPVSSGTVLHRGDMLQLGSGSKAAILCDNLQLWWVPVGGLYGVSNGCPPTSEPDLLRSEGQIGRTRGANLWVPYILNPRSTNISSGQPLLRWNSVPGATEYQVQVRGGRLNWIQTITSTETIYPGNPPLEPGVVYKLIVTSDTGASSEEEGVPNLGFRLLMPEEQAIVTSDIARIMALNVPDLAKEVVLAYYFAGKEDSDRRLVADAVLRIQVLIDKDQATTGTLLLLGHLYESIGLPHEAIAVYQHTLELAAANGEIEAMARAQVGLARLYWDQPDHTLQVQAWMQEAAMNYETLGDSETVDQIRQNWVPLLP